MGSCRSTVSTPCPPANKRNVTGIVIGIMIPIVPQLVPVANEMIDDSKKITVGSILGLSRSLSKSARYLPVARY